MEEMKIGFGEELHVQLEDCAPKRIEELETTLAKIRELKRYDFHHDEVVATDDGDYVRYAELAALLNV